MEKFNAWRELTKFIDSYPIDSIINRKMIMTYFKGLNVTEGTLDKNRCWLTEAGYLESYKLGSYKIIKKIGELTSSACEEKAYPQRFKYRQYDYN